MSDASTTAIAAASLNALATAVAACGPPGAPLALLAASLSVLVLYSSSGPAPKTVPVEDVVRKEVGAQLDSAAVKAALSKIFPAVETYLEWAARIDRSAVLSSQDVAKLRANTADVVGPNSTLREGLGLLYNNALAPSDFARVQYAVPQFMLGSTILTRFRMIDLGLARLDPASMQPIPPSRDPQTALVDLQQILDQLLAYERDLDRIVGYVSRTTIQQVLYAEMQAPNSPLRIGAPNSDTLRVAREGQLQFAYLGGRDAPTNHRQLLLQLTERVREEVRALQAMPA